MNRIKIRIQALLALFLTSIMLSSCSHAPGHDISGTQSRKELDSLRNIYRSYNVDGLYDSLLVIAKKNIKQSFAEDDSLAILCSGTYLAHTYLMLENIDSVEYYINFITPYRKKGEENDPSLQTVLYIIEGLLHLKSELNYSLALESFRHGCEWAEIGNDPNNHIVLLANIAHIFYVRQDRNGLEYAVKAYEISQRPDVADFPRCQANLLMGQMLLLSNEPDKAEKYLNTAKKMIDAGEFKSLKSIYNLLLANIYKTNSDFVNAEKCFEEAITWSYYAEIGTTTSIYVDYGQLCQEQGMYDRALDLYMAGLEVSRTHNSMEFRSELLSRISDIYRSIGNKASAAEYSYLYKSFTDSIANLQKEQEFNSRLMYYSQIEHEHEIQAKELALLQARRKSATAIFISLTIVIIALFLYVMYMKQKKMNRTLVMQYENYIQRTQLAEQEKSSGTKEKTKTAEQELFLRIEEMMQQQKIYRQKDLSLDRLSEMLSSNRAYVSKAINTCSSQSFFSYVDQYRIREAVSVLSSESEKNGTMPFKQIADMVGYNSVQVFYRSFKRETGCSPGQYKEEARRIRKQRGNGEE